MRRILLATLLALCGSGVAWAVNGSALQLNSGAIIGNDAQLNNNGYAGAYITLASQGSVTVTVNAKGTSTGGIDPKMNIVIADTKADFNVLSSGSNPYVGQFDDLPAGTYFIRAGYTNDGGTGRAAGRMVSALRSGKTSLDRALRDAQLAAVGRPEREWALIAAYVQ